MGRARPGRLQPPGDAALSLVWAVPALAAAVAMGVVLVRSRALEDAVSDLAGEVRELRRLRAPLAEVRRAAEDTEALAEEFRAAHAPDGDERPGYPG